MAASHGAVASVNRLDRCGYCAKHPERARCTYCTGRRRRAGRLADQGLSVAEIAGQMAITEHWAETLLVEEHSVRELETLRCNDVPAEMVLAAVERWQQRAPEYNTWSELASRLRFRSAVTLRRALGAVTKDGRRRTKVKVELAGRVMKAMGFAPCEFEWL